ncbi:hypothetical protein B0T24DRAFT_212988 [Lasiosphaeria ovina]|uniref:Uncharacterized protein n=1 Tax=Lasiosphaeria ovina TaxID=92902 RepID=A0AAE0NB16_9PEZI|nr:hypothetical protein B0T24DRAFT_212988 [Lasiosphaeria ovina]
MAFVQCRNRMAGNIRRVTTIINGFRVPCFCGFNLLQTLHSSIPAQMTPRRTYGRLLYGYIIWASLPYLLCISSLGFAHTIIDTDQVPKVGAAEAAGLIAGFPQKVTVMHCAGMLNSELTLPGLLRGSFWVTVDLDAGGVVVVFAVTDKGSLNQPASPASAFVRLIKLTHPPPPSPSPSSLGSEAAGTQ